MIYDMAKFQIGKNGVTENFISTLKTAFKTRVNVKIMVLKSAGHEKEKAKEFADLIVEKLGKNYIYRIVGFTIFLKRFRKNVR